MAMTKKEKAAFDKAIYDLEVRSALRWTEPVERDLSPPDKSSEKVYGWDHNFHAMMHHGSVDQACTKSWTTCVSHSFGGGWSGSQGAKRLYWTRLLALKAMRHEMETYFAEKLREVDKAIEEEQAK